MALILSLDSSTEYCSVAVHENGDLIIDEVGRESRDAASRMAPMIKRIMTKSGINSGDLSAIAVSSGPGSYTGLRIATSTAKGLCFSLQVPLVAVNSLLVMTAQLTNYVEADAFCPMLDARRMEVYCALVNSRLEFLKPVEAKILDGHSFRTELEHSRIAFFGDGSEKFRKIVNHNNSIFVDSIQPRARELGVLAQGQFEAGNFQNASTFEPYYLKDFMLKK